MRIKIKTLDTKLKILSRKDFFQWAAAVQLLLFIYKKSPIDLEKTNVYLLNFPREIIITHLTDTLEYKQFLINSDQ